MADVRHPSPLKAVLAGAAVLLVCAEAGLAILGHGAPKGANMAGEIIYHLLITSAAVAVLARAATQPSQRLAWGLIGAGLAFWSLGDLYYWAFLQNRPDPPYPSISDGLFFAFYALAAFGFYRLGVRIRNQPLAWSILAVSLLGLGMIWSAVAFIDVAAAAAGDIPAVATTLAYPLFDLLLLGTALTGLVTRGWALDRVSILLMTGIGVMAGADLVYSVQVAQGTYVDGTILDVLWPMGTLLLAWAAWSRPTQLGRRYDGEALAPFIAMVAIALAITLQVWDHFSRLDTAAVLLSGATLVASMNLLVRVYRDRTVAQRLALSSESLRSASTEAALDCVISTDGGGRIREWNAAASRTFGYETKEVLGKDLVELIIPPDRRETYQRELERSLQNGSGMLLDQRMEVTAMRASGAHFPVELAITQVQDDPPMFTGFLRDIEKQKRRQEETERLAMIVRSAEDAILSKDRHRIVTAWNNGAERLYGYTAGEAVGRPLASLIIPPGENNMAELERVSKALFSGESMVFETQRQRKDGELIEVSLRGFPAHDLNGDIVGASTIAHDITERRLQKRREAEDREGQVWKGRIRKALDLNEFVFWGQAVVDLDSHVIDHYELLLRMVAGGGLVMPNQFIPYAERSGMIREIDIWAVKTGLEFAQTVPVAINLSARSFGNSKLFELIRTELAHSHTPPRNVTIEITETAAAEDLDGARRLVERLRDFGCGVALDDFGTGFGSFTYLQHLPFTELKIDIEFIRALTRDPTDQRLVSSIVSIANRFGMKTVAEGVEDEATLKILRDLDVDLAQGYHVGYPGRMSTVGVGATSVAPIRDADLPLHGIDRGAGAAL